MIVSITPISAFYTEIESPDLIFEECKYDCSCNAMYEYNCDCGCEKTFDELTLSKFSREEILSAFMHEISQALEQRNAELTEIWNQASANIQAKFNALQDSEYSLNEYIQKYIQDEFLRLLELNILESQLATLQRSNPMCCPFPHTGLLGSFHIHTRILGLCIGIDVLNVFGCGNCLSIHRTEAGRPLPPCNPSC